MNAKQIAAIESALATANGRRRHRLASIEDVLTIVRIVASGADGTGMRRTCGTVPNSYSYKANATVITAVRAGDVVRVRVREGNAARVAGGGKGHTESAANVDVRELLSPSNAAESFIAIPVASAKRPVAKKSA